ncbi:type II toxin-antitoxin system ParD family antitoxin [Rhizobium sp. TRM96647]|uniref:type II toxin-antitoxin system ParD family antitoxin n=1 Tax=unclassified Rhizobium TaxID=2613769 RepID=UPI0021E7ED0C|nr:MULTISPECIES: type II toxin-antitoxin system ParD family antitoxin [unclassified Rhizobium]MCV3738508.1 type II toxin-antitoxin system ParD family antitoxin [Rhizobium sp. TRM96647]MCV3760195.1 type II toxin-antitoxin system ParD family antitoxin [Rhizobium sp. TRM96650]
MPTLNVSLTPEFSDFIEESVASGSYVSASEVVREALRIMRDDRDSEAVKIAVLRNAVETGLAQSRRGELSDRSVRDIFSAIADGE